MLHSMSSAPILVFSAHGVPIKDACCHHAQWTGCHRKVVTVLPMQTMAMSCVSYLAALCSCLVCANHGHELCILLSSAVLMLGVRLQPRCDEPWTEVVYEDSSEGKLTVSASTRAAFTAVPVISTCPTQTLPDLKCMWRPPPSALARLCSRSSPYA